MAAAGGAAGAGSGGTEIAVVVEQPPTSIANETEASTTGPPVPVLDVKTNPDLPSPARVRWMDAFSRVCAHLNQVRAIAVIIIIIIITVITINISTGWAKKNRTVFQS